MKNSRAGWDGYGLPLYHIYVAGKKNAPIQHAIFFSYYWIMEPVNGKE